VTAFFLSILCPLLGQSNFKETNLCLVPCGQSINAPSKILCLSRWPCIPCRTYVGQGPQAQLQCWCCGISEGCMFPVGPGALLHSNPRPWAQHSYLPPWALLGMACTAHCLPHLRQLLSFEIGSHCVAQAGIETSGLKQPPPSASCSWNYRCVPLHLTSFEILSILCRAVPFVSL
jgi:hypothetical protein